VSSRPEGSRLEARAVADADAAAVEELVAAHSLSRLQREPPFVGKPRHAHLWADVQQTMASSDAASAVFVGAGGVDASLGDGRQGEHGARVGGRASADGVRGLCIVRTPDWDRRHFGFVLGRIEYLIAADAAAAAAAAEWALERLTAAGVRVVSARVPAEDLTVIGALEASGFGFMEHLLTPWRAWKTWEHKGCRVTRLTEPDDLPILYDIARATFRTDHFHLDTRFDPAAADGVYSRWIESWHADPPPGARSRVIVVDGRVSGFFMYRFTEPAGLAGHTGGECETRRVTDLVLGGMAPDMAGRGQGYRMYCDVMDDAAANTEYGRVTIVTANVAVLNLYMKLGFRFSTGGEVTFHKWLA